MTKSEEKYIKDQNLSNEVVKTKTSHGRIETAIRVRNAKSKKDLDLELKRLKILNEIDKSSLKDELILPKEIRNYQQLILIIGSLNLKTTTEISLACKKLGYLGSLNRSAISGLLMTEFKDYFNYDKVRGWLLTTKGQNEFSRLKQFT